MKAQTANCEYYDAVLVLVNAESTMGQCTPPAVQPNITKQQSGLSKSVDSIYEVSKKRLRPRCFIDDNDSPQKKMCKSISNILLSSEISNDETYTQRKERLWTDMQTTEERALFHVQPNYTATCKFMFVGARRKAVNIIFLMSNTLNLEICTSGLGVLTMDRVLSAQNSISFCLNSIILVAMACLNTVGKVVDIDRGYCGSSGVVEMIRDAVPMPIKQQSYVLFAKYFTAIEREILCTIDSTLLSHPCATQIIAYVTDWNHTNELLWLRASLLCDIFCTDSLSTNFSQTQIARAAVGLSLNPPTRHDITEHMTRSMVMFANSNDEIIFWKDPYFGVRRRHAKNPEIFFVLVNAKRLHEMFCTSST